MMRNLALAAVCFAPCSGALADCFTTFSGPLDTTRPVFEAAAGTPLFTESFDGLSPGDIVGKLPGAPASFAPEYADGSPAPLPVVFANSPVTPPNWMGNLENDRPAWSAWVVVPEEGQSFYAFGQVNSQGDWVRVEAFDAAGSLVGSVDAPPIAHAFAGFISTIPIARVVITPLGNDDGANGMDDVQVSLTPPCTADADHNGVLDLFDFLSYTNDFNAGASCADCDDNGTLNLFDFLCFVNSFNVGC